MKIDMKIMRLYEAMKRYRIKWKYIFNMIFFICNQVFVGDERWECPIGLKVKAHGRGQCTAEIPSCLEGECQLFKLMFFYFVYSYVCQG